MITYVLQPPSWDARQPQGRSVILRPNEVHATLEYLRACIRARKDGYLTSYTTDPEWLIDVAINRRAGWPDDPSHSRGSCMPVNGKYPKRAEGDVFWLCWRLARDLNGTRVTKHECEVRCVPRRVRERIMHRTRDCDY